MKNFISLIICTSLIINLTSCGTILHPERKGQIDGQLDTSVVVLDAVGLLFFLIPGIIAFAVDFSNGTIYLPNGYSSSLSNDEVDQITSNGKINIHGLRKLISDKTDLSISTDDNDIQIKAVSNTNELSNLFYDHSAHYMAAL